MCFYRVVLLRKNESEDKKRYRKDLDWRGYFLSCFSRISLVNLCFIP